MATTRSTRAAGGILDGGAGNDYYNSVLVPTTIVELDGGGHDTVVIGTNIAMTIGDFVEVIMPMSFLHNYYGTGIDITAGAGSQIMSGGLLGDTLRGGAGWTNW